MELYLDTSALVKLYIAEPGYDAVGVAVRNAAQVATSMLAYAEARSAFSRRFREGVLSDGQLGDVIQALNADWLQTNRIPVTDEIAYSAGDLAQQFALRGMDAIHLASAIWMRRHFAQLEFFAFDDRLMDAARQVLPVYEMG